MNAHEVESIYSDSLESSQEIDSPQDGMFSNNKCHICGKGSIFRSKKFCRFCNKVTCQTHSQKKKIKPGYDKPKRICVNCDEKLTIKEIKEEIDKDIEKIGKEILNEKIIKEKTRKEFQEREELIGFFIDSIEKQEKMIKETEEKYVEKIRNEISKGEVIRSQIETRRKSMNEHMEKEKNLSKEANEKENIVISNSEEYESLKIINSEIENEIETIKSAMKKSVMKKNLEKTLCKKCYNLIQEDTLQ